MKIPVRKAEGTVPGKGTLHSAFALAAGYAALITIVLLYFGRPGSETLCRYPEKEVRIIPGTGLVSMQISGPPVKTEGRGVYTLEADAVYAFDLGRAEKIREAAVMIGELDREGIPAILCCEDETEGTPAFLSRGWNSFAPVKGKGMMRLFLIPDRKISFRLTGAALIREGAGKVFPWNALILMSVLYFASTGLRGAGKESGGRGRAVRFLCRFVFFMMQLRNTWFAFDDYGYLSLTYRNLFDQRGLSYGLADIASFLLQHYLQWGGRVTAFFLEILAGRSIILIRIAESAVLAGICEEMMLLMCGNPEGSGQREKNTGFSVLEAVLPVILWCFIDLEIQRDSAWWYTAAVLYLWPIYGTLAGIRLYEKYCRGKGHIIPKTVSCVLIFFAASSQEQVCAAVLLMTGICILRERTARGTLPRPGFYGVMVLLSALSGAVLLLAAPGNYVRLGEGRGPGPAANAMALLRMLGSDQTHQYLFLFTCAAAASGIAMFRRGSRMAAAHLAAGAASAVLSGALLITGGGLTSVCQMFLRRAGLEKMNPAVNLFLPALLIAGEFEILRLLFKLGEKQAVILTAGAAASLLFILPSPGISARMLLPPALLMLPVIGTVLMRTVFCRNAPLLFAGRKGGCVFRAVFFGILIAAGGMNQDSILTGYWHNSGSEEYNAAVLKDYDGRKDENGLVTLHKHHDDAYGNMMPYMEGYEWIEEYMKAMYGLPENAVFRWEEDTDE